MPDKELTIRISAVDAGVSQMANRIARDLQEMVKKSGGKLEITPEVKTQIIEQQIERARREQEQKKIKLEIDVAAKDMAAEIQKQMGVVPPVQVPIQPVANQSDMEAFQQHMHDALVKRNERIAKDYAKAPAVAPVPPPLPPPSAEDTQKVVAEAQQTAARVAKIKSDANRASIAQQAQDAAKQHAADLELAKKVAEQKRNIINDLFSKNVAQSKSSGLDDLKNQFAQLGQEIGALGGASKEASKKGEGGWEEFAGSLKKNFGRGSSFREIFELLHGAGPIIGLGFAAKFLEHETEEVKNFYTELREAKKDAAELTLEFLQAIPIIGSVAKAIDNIEETITGDRYALKEANEEAEQLAKNFESIGVAVRGALERVIEFESRTKGVQAETANIGLRGFQKENAEADTSVAERHRKDQEEQEKADRERKERFDKQFAPLFKAREEANKELENARRNTRHMLGSVSTEGLVETNDTVVEKREKADLAQRQIDIVSRQRMGEEKTDHAARKQLAEAEDEKSTKEAAVRAYEQQREINLQKQKADQETASGSEKIQSEAIALESQAYMTSGQRKLAIQKRTQAEILEVERKTKAEIFAIDREAEEKVHAGRGDPAQIGKEAADKRQQAETRDIQEKAKLRERERAEILAEVRWEADTEHKHQEDLKSIRSSTNAAILTIDGKGFTAQQQQLDTALEERIEAIKQQAKVEKRAHADQAGEIDKRAGEDIVAAQEKAAADKRSVTIREQRWEKDQEFQHAREIHHIQAEAQANRLRQMGLEFEATRVQRQAEFQERIAAIRQQAEVEKREHAERAPEIDKRTREREAAEADKYRTDIAGDVRNELQNAKQAATLPSLVESRFLTGQAQSGKEGLEKDLLIGTLEKIHNREEAYFTDRFQDLHGWILEGKSGGAAPPSSEGPEEGGTPAANAGPNPVPAAPAATPTISADDGFNKGRRIPFADATHPIGAIPDIASNPSLLYGKPPPPDRSVTSGGGGYFALQNARSRRQSQRTQEMTDARHAGIAPSRDLTVSAPSTGGGGFFALQNARSARQSQRTHDAITTRHERTQQAVAARHMPPAMARAAAPRAATARAAAPSALPQKPAPAAYATREQAQSAKQNEQILNALKDIKEAIPKFKSVTTLFGPQTGRSF